MLFKKQLRRPLLETRLTLDKKEQQKFSEQIARKVIQLHLFKKAHRIALYSTFAGEVSTQLILETAIKHHKICYFPVLSNHRLAFVKVDVNTRLFKNQFGILEPILTDSNVIAPQALDVVLMPLVGFDKHCHRLGMGKGYYDKTFAFRKRGAKPALIGLAYDFQEIRRVPHSKLDVVLDMIVTQHKILKKHPIRPNSNTKTDG